MSEFLLWRKLCLYSGKISILLLKVTIKYSTIVVSIEADNISAGTVESAVLEESKLGSH